VAASGPIHLYPTDPLAALLDAAADLLDLTFDQLRTVAVVHQTGSELSAARTLGREQELLSIPVDQDFKRLPRPGARQRRR
jgi:hypothetical protein